MTYVFLVAVLNLGLGFTLAVYLGRRYRDLVADGDPWSVEATAELPAGNARQAASQASATEDMLFDVPVQEAAAQTYDMAEPAGAADPPQPEAAGEGALPPQPTHEESPGEASVEHRIEAVDEHAEKPTVADEALWQSDDSPQADEIEKVLGSLMEATQEYLDCRDQEHAIL